MFSPETWLQHYTDVAFRRPSTAAAFSGTTCNKDHRPEHDSPRAQFAQARTTRVAFVVLLPNSSLGHDNPFILLSILNSDDTDSSLWIRLIPSPNSSATLEHGDLQSLFTARTGVLLVVINSSILDFCNRPMATSTKTMGDTKRKNLLLAPPVFQNFRR